MFESVALSYTIKVNISNYRLLGPTSIRNIYNKLGENLLQVTKMNYVSSHKPI